MARTWRKGHFGLGVLSGISLSFNELNAGFDDNLTARYTDILKTITNDVEVPDVALLVFTPITVDIPTYSMVQYTAVETEDITVDIPVYSNIGAVV
jgi:hypothetical protein